MPEICRPEDLRQGPFSICPKWVCVTKFQSLYHLRILRTSNGFFFEFLSVLFFNVCCNSINVWHFLRGNLFDVSDIQKNMKQPKFKDDKIRLDYMDETSSLGGLVHCIGTKCYVNIITF